MRLDEEDFEREAQKDYMYLLEKEMEEEEEYREWIKTHEQRLPAKIKILTKRFHKAKTHKQKEDGRT